MNVTFPLSNPRDPTAVMLAIKRAEAHAAATGTTLVKTTILKLAGHWVLAAHCEK